MESKASVNSKNIFILYAEVNKMEETINNLIKDENIMKEKFIEIQYLVSYSMCKLLIGRGVILKTKRNWKQKKMDNSFFKYLNFTLPCGSDCAIEYGEPRECHLNLDDHTLSMDFNIPIVNPNLSGSRPILSNAKGRKSNLQN